MYSSMSYDAMEVQALCIVVVKCCLKQVYHSQQQSQLRDCTRSFYSDKIRFRKPFYSIILYFYLTNLDLITDYQKYYIIVVSYLVVVSEGD